MKPIHSNCIPRDGYIEPGYLDAIPGLHGEFRFSFRPLTEMEQGVFVDGTKDMPTKTRSVKMYDLIASRIASWEHRDDTGEPVAICSKSVSQLKPAIVGALYGIVLGTRPSDIDPLWEQEVQQETADAALTALLEGRTVGDVAAERDEKN